MLNLNQTKRFRRHTRFKLIKNRHKKDKNVDIKTIFTYYCYILLLTLST